MFLYIVAYHVYLTDQFENQPNEICSHLSQKTGFLSPVSSKITLTKEKQRRERESEEEERRRREKSNGCTLSFYNGYFEIFFYNGYFEFLAEKNYWTEKNGPFQLLGVFKNPARVCTVTNVYEINHI